MDESQMHCWAKVARHSVYIIWFLLHKTQKKQNLSMITKVSIAVTFGENGRSNNWEGALGASGVLLPGVGCSFCDNSLNY